MKHPERSIIKSLSLAVSLLAGTAVSLSATAGPLVYSSKIDGAIVDALKQAPATDLFVKMADDASLQQADAINGRIEKAQFVYDVLTAHAANSQTEIMTLINAEGLTSTSYWINNSIFVQGASREFTAKLAARGDVAYLRANREVPMHKPVVEANSVSPNAVEWGVDKISAPLVWAAGNTGQGVVVANIDTGVRWTHEAITNQYRGRDLGSHDYSWWDPKGNLAEPTDNNGHGTHTMGTMVGDDGGANQIGVAPGAKWIAAKGCGLLFCSENDLISSAQWIACPTKVDGTAPDCSKVPHVVNNSWGGGGGENWYLSYVNSWLAAGIFPVFSAGNSGPNCNTIGSPGDYVRTLSVGATDINDRLADFSSKGPSVFGGSPLTQAQPYIVAPGENVRSSVHSSDSAYNNFSGTSMSGPHIAGTVALMMSGNPAAGLLSIANAIGGTAFQGLPAPPGDTSCGGIPYDSYPNAIHGHGRVNAKAAVDAL